MNSNGEDGYEIVPHSVLLPSESSNHWNRKHRIKWTITLFFGCFLAYSSHTTLSICSVEMANELGWDKRLSVSIY